MKVPMTTTSNYYVTTFYKFLVLADVPAVQKDLENKAEELNVKGLIILGTEGFNSTCAAPSVESFEAWKQFIREYFNLPTLFFKDSVSPKAPFRRFKVKVREEIVTTGIPEIMPPEGKNQHLTPSEWNKVMKEESDYVMIDTRNWYEYKIGTFKGALNPNIEKFTDFPQYIEQQGIAKDKKMLIFCTGRKDALFTCFYVLKNLMIMLAPFVPDTMNELRKTLNLPESVFRAEELGTGLPVGHAINPKGVYFPAVAEEAAGDSEA
jgi:hypothetical protein